MATYYLVGRRKGPNGGITHFRVLDPNGDLVRYSYRQVVDIWTGGHKLFTGRIVNGKLRKLAPVYAVLKTDPNSTIADNIGRLPEY